MYTTSENFMNNVVDAIRTNRKTQDTAATSNLRKNYRNVDVLLIDDIQFIIGKEDVYKRQEISDGETPLILAACPTDFGRISDNF